LAAGVSRRSSFSERMVGVGTVDLLGHEASIAGFARQCHDIYAFDAKCRGWHDWPLSGGSIGGVLPLPRLIFWEGLMAARATDEVVGYIEAAGVADQPGTPLFRAFDTTARRLGDGPLSRNKRRQKLLAAPSSLASRPTPPITPSA
jgi:hypothetical protein